MRRLYALLLSGVVLTAGLWVLLPDAMLVAGGLAIAAAAVGLLLVNRTQRIIAGVLVGVGIVSVAAVLVLGGQIVGRDLFSVNQDRILPHLRGEVTLFASAGVLAVGLRTGLTMLLSARYGTDSITLTHRNLIQLAVAIVAAWPALLLCAAPVSSSV